ncbi:hypothetical protein J6590_091707 [Homalodisca vitripennis]|nr:hypothetical protein J6590_091707 [Homalodisca vitripennis]
MLRYILVERWCVGVMDDDEISDLMLGSIPVRSAPKRVEVFLLLSALDVQSERLIWIQSTQSVGRISHKLRLHVGSGPPTKKYPWDRGSRSFGF